MLKVYGITGRTTAMLTIPTGNGKAFIKCEFKHGRMGLGIGNKPATYHTSDPVTQNIIETSNEYKKGLIKIVRAYNDEGSSLSPAELMQMRKNPGKNGIRIMPRGQKVVASKVSTPVPEADPVEAEPVNIVDEEPAAPVETPSEGENTGGESYPEVTTHAQAVAILKAKGVKVSEIRSTENALKVAAKMGIEFPNFKV